MRRKERGENAERKRKLRKSRGDIEARFVQNAKTVTESIKIH